MTVAQFQVEAGDVHTQALTCFRGARELVQGMGRRIDSTSIMIVEVARRDLLPAVMAARTAVFGGRRPARVSNRLSQLPGAQLVRVTIELDTSDGVT